MKRIARWTGIVIGSVLVLSLALGASVQAVATRSALRRYKAPGRMVDVGGHRLHIHCTGESVDGLPTVILESGFGGWTIDWASIQPDIATSTRVCSYDRSGHGWSERGPASEAGRDGIARQLRRLLDEAGIGGPYVLVGHSLGGFYVREFARQNPDDVVGMLFVDSSHEEMSKKSSSKEREQAVSQLKMLKYLRYLMPFGAQRLVKQPISNGRSLPVSDRPAADGVGYRTTAYFALYDQAAALLAEDTSGTLTLEPVPEVPIVTLVSEENAEEFEWWTDLQHELADLTSDGELVIAEGSGHFIHVDKPEIVLDAIEKVIKEGRR